MARASSPVHLFTLAKKRLVFWPSNSRQQLLIRLEYLDLQVESEVPCASSGLPSSILTRPVVCSRSASSNLALGLQHILRRKRSGCHFSDAHRFLGQHLHRWGYVIFEF